MSNFKIHELNSLAVNRNSNIIHDTEVSTDEWDTGKNLAGAVADLASANVAAPYDTTVTYAIGQYCLYEGNIYRCIAITTGAFDSTKWTQIVVTGEFRRVVELTSAQYTALSSAEKNNGTLYIITDEETTAADIPYSAGVSVADKLDSLNNKVITPTYATQTNFTFPYNNNRIVRSGNVVMVYLGVHCDTPYGANPGVKVISGLPKPDATSNIFFTASCWNNNDSRIRVMLDTDGAIFLRVGVASHDYDVMFSYITKD